MAGDRLALGVDFGTSNSSAGFMRAGRVALVPMMGGDTSMPTTFFFDYDSRKTLMGAPANEALLMGAEGRFMRALKRVLGTSLMHEPRQLLNARVTFVEVIARFLSEIKTRAEAEAGTQITRVLSGRPVVFHGTEDRREAQAEADLRACYEAAGFEEIAFMAEPEAAALASGAGADRGIGLIVDVGGGTSDFSVFESTRAGIRILANHGVRIGGTDFDRSISIAQVMPLLGKGSQLRKVLGAGTTPAPNAIFNDLATWEKIPFLYTPQVRRDVEDMLQLAEAPEAMGRLHAVLSEELGHEMAFAVERGKIAANGGDAQAEIDLGEIETGLRAPLPLPAMADALARHGEALEEGAAETLRRASVRPGAVDRVIFVGGSSLMGVVSHKMKTAFPQAEHSVAKVFTAVAEGLALAAQDHWR